MFPGRKENLSSGSVAGTTFHVSVRAVLFLSAATGLFPQGL